MYLANEIENEAFIKFINAHNKCLPQKKFWGKLPEKTIDVSFSWNNGIGTALTVSCSICGVSENITDFNCW